MPTQADLIYLGVLILIAILMFWNEFPIGPKVQQGNPPPEGDDGSGGTPVALQSPFLGTVTAYREPLPEEEEFEAPQIIPFPRRKSDERPLAL